MPFSVKAETQVISCLRFSIHCLLFIFTVYCFMFTVSCLQTAQQYESEYLEASQLTARRHHTSPPYSRSVYHPFLIVPSTQGQYFILPSSSPLLKLGISSFPHPSLSPLLKASISSSSHHLSSTLLLSSLILPTALILFLYLILSLSLIVHICFIP